MQPARHDPPAKRVVHICSGPSLCGVRLQGLMRSDFGEYGVKQTALEMRHPHVHCDFQDVTQDFPFGFHLCFLCLQSVSDPLANSLRHFTDTS
jgi:hypothetical protein